MNRHLKKFNNWLHLWLGLLSGSVVFIVALTGCIYVFQQEIKDITEPWRFVEAQNIPFAAPSQLVDTARAYVPGVKPTGLTYEGREGAAAVGFIYNEDNQLAFSVVFMNPYTGEYIKRVDPLGKGHFDFFHFIESGHRNLWLPYDIGHRIIGISTLIFLVLLITGIVMWWPKKWNQHHLERAFKIKWGANSKRLTLDLHNAPGFYILLFACVFAITGLVWSFEWFGKGFYFLTSGGESKQEHVHPHSDITKARLAIDGNEAIDKAFYLTLQQEPRPARIFMTPVLKEADESIEIVVSQIKGKFYKHNEYFYDRYTLEALRVEGDRYKEADFAEKLDKMNYDIHTGAILGLPGKILAFLLSLGIASLPVTGFLIWKNKRG